MLVFRVGLDTENITLNVTLFNKHSFFKLMILLSYQIDIKTMVNYKFFDRTLNNRTSLLLLIVLAQRLLLRSSTTRLRHCASFFPRSVSWRMLQLLQ